MTNRKCDLNKLIKSEADDTLFADIEFTSKMKDEIIGKIKTSNTEMSNLGEKKKRKLVNRWLFSIGVGVASVFIVVSTVLLSGSLQQEKPNHGPQTLFEDDVTLPSDGPKTFDQDLESAEDAKDILGTSLLLPTYVPKDYELERIHTLSVYNKQQEKVIFTYVSEERSYLIIAEKAEQEMQFPNSKRVEIHETTGYVLGNENDSELHFYKDNIHYMIGGLISQEEAIRIAKGLIE